MFTILVCGGRDYMDIDKVYCTLDSVVDKHGLWHPDYPTCVSQDLLIVSGGARGADAFAREWAGERGARINEYLPNWSKYGLRAGPLRNAEMLQNERVDLVVAFPGGAGTRDMISRAQKARIEVKIIK
jgi:hypothetical protein